MGLRAFKMYGLGFVLWLLFTATASWAIPPLAPYVYQEDFETSDPFEYWVSNGSYTVNSKGITSEKSSVGAKSFKLDISLDSATYVYFMIPVDIPSVGTLSFKGDIYIQSITGGLSASLGTNATHHPYSNSWVNVIQKLGTAGGSWTTQSSNLAAEYETRATSVVASKLGGATIDDVGRWTNKIVLYLYASSPGRIVLYIDNVVVEGQIPSASEYETFTQSAWQSYLTRIQSEVNTMADVVTSFDRQLEDSEESAYLQTAQARTVEIKNSVASRGYATPAEYTELKEYYATVPGLGQVSATESAMAVYPWPAITDAMVLPDSYPIPASVGDNLSLKACRGEYEPVSFILRALRPLSNVRIAWTDLVGSGGGTIPASEVDIRLVKCWYQSGRDSILPGAKVLVPELLLKDDDLVRVDTVAQTNALRVTVGGQQQYVDITSATSVIPDGAVLSDASSLQPFNLDEDRNKQVWITVHVPETAAAGSYQGTVEVSPENESTRVLTLSVEVLSFELKPSILEYGLYYRGKLDSNPGSALTSEKKSSTLYRKEIEDMKRHGVLYPTLYNHNTMMDQVLSIRNEVGLPQDKYYSCGLSTGNPTDADGLAALKLKVTEQIALARQYGYDEVYAYGKDEAVGDALLSQRAAWQAVHEAGGKVFVACDEGAADLMGDLLDTAVLHGYKPDEVAKWHQYGKRVLKYHSPQVGEENPLSYRQEYGLKLWCGGYDGAMNYAYQHGFGHVWNDFDSDRYRDHVFAYPTSDGVIDTVEWEGFREAVDDTRYLSTWLSRVSDTASVKDWVCTQVSHGSDLSEVRASMIETILGLPSVSVPVMSPPANLQVLER